MNGQQIRAGLRVDVDTLRGTRYGVVSLLDILARHDIQATFFFSVGPDNMGRHLWRLVRPAFLWKMIRSRAYSLYGPSMLLQGTLWPGPSIGRRCGAVFRRTWEQGHEIGLHAWDHHQWQAHIGRMGATAVRAHLEQGCRALEAATGAKVTCSAAPGWRCTDVVLLEKERLNFCYNSDCRGNSIFYPLVDGRRLSQPQIPTTLPTYDELIGRDGIGHQTYNQRLLQLFTPGRLNVLTIHAEVEGMSCQELFDDFLLRARRQGIGFSPLGKLLADKTGAGQATMAHATVAGREGWVSVQKEEQP